MMMRWPCILQLDFVQELSVSLGMIFAIDLALGNGLAVNFEYQTEIQT